MAGFNPKKRMRKSILKKLRDSISEHGILCPLMVGKDGVLADGHRRLLCAVELGIETVPVIFLELNASDAYIQVNDSQKASTSADKIQAVDQGLPLESLDQKSRRDIIRLMTIMGDDGFSMLADRGRGLTVLRDAIRVARHIGFKSNKDLRTIILWFEKWGMQYKTRKAIEKGSVSPDVVRAAILENRPLQERYVIG
jgi:hypothetical protein